MGKKNRFYKQVSYTTMLALLATVVFFSCATHTAQRGKNITTNTVKINSDVVHSFYLFGDTHGLEKNSNQYQAIENELKKAPKNSSIFWLGNNAKAEVLGSLKKATTAKNYIFNGENEWKAGYDSLMIRETSYRKKSIQVLPSKICAIETLEVNDSLAVLAIDSEWFLEDWSDHPKATENCPIQTRELFFTELQNKLNDYQNRITIIAMHHPVISNGKHGGKFSVQDQLFPIENRIPMPVIGSFVNLVRATTGLTSQDLQSHRYRDFTQRVSTIIGKRENVLIFSAHDRSLQYLQDGNVRQIISGASVKATAAKVAGENDYSNGKKGFAKVKVYANGASDVEFFNWENGQAVWVHTQEMTTPRKEYLAKVYDKNIPKEKVVSVVDQKNLKKSQTYETFFGKHYRSVFGIEFPVETLDLQKRNIRPIRENINLQTINLRLQDNENAFVMIPVRKSATQLIQSIAYKNEYVANDFENTFTEKFLNDFQTTQHPFYPLIVPNIAQLVKVNQLKSTLYYVPKQELLKEYNENFGDEIYFLEQYPVVKDTLSDFTTTEEVLRKIVENKHQKIDREQYIRARLLDMLIGDWNRNEAQWTWRKSIQGQDTIYTPYSKTREFIFPKYDGLFFNLLMRLAPFRHMENYKNQIRSVKWFNKIAYPIDMALLQNTTEEEWQKQADYLQNTINKENLEKAFAQLPKKVQSKIDYQIIETILERKEKLPEYASEYQKVLDKLVILKGTNKDEKFLVERLPKGETKVLILDKENNETLFERVFDRKNTKEIRLYGMNGNDDFLQKGKGSNLIKVRMIGGVDDDTYQINTRQKTKVYDDKSNKDLSGLYMYDDYEINTYDYKKPKYNTFSVVPNAGYNPDDGVKLGLIGNYTINGFDRKPYSQKHQLQFDYFFATDAFDVKYKGTFMKAIGKWNFDVNASYTSPSFVNNYFGMGNETINYQKEHDMDYNRVRMQTYKLGPSFFKIFNNTGRLDFFANYRYAKVERNLDRIVNDDPSVHYRVFNGQNFGEIGASYLFRNYDNLSLPTMGFTFSFLAKWVNNLDYLERNFQYIEANIGFTHKLINNGRLTLASMVKGKALFGDGYEFYQATNIGGDQDLRGYRTGRFTGEQAFVHSTDLRYNLTKVKTFIPLQIGVFTGFDYGRIWMKDENSTKWHNALGGGIWINGARAITGTLSFFKGEDPGRVVFGLNFGF
ncbi:Surface antigen [Weeksella virosa]|uniref:metallophosphoesterase n=1 Tax=Weeksella virosa TaxID=1014 RepID=UPI000DFC5B99|nr:metallophosphoesterase [Weeksella virosa]SUP54640.1 Surface antigen [Weeksella virosa]